MLLLLKKNRLLQELDLSHNNFGEESGKILGAFISMFFFQNLKVSLGKKTQKIILILI